ncbi:MAG: hypothetical protein NVV59_19450 [Chitinophagaceae bacterium]|nr:hypothetical protein [Chitinophagaceae bacterium]
MKNEKNTYHPLQYISNVFMMLVLAWLTISAPIVNGAKMESAGTQDYLELADMPDNEDPGSGNYNPFGNNTEEKASNGSAGFTEEYLHHSDDLLHAANLSLQHFRALAAREYTAFHGELLCPPPNSLS